MGRFPGGEISAAIGMQPIKNAMITKCEVGLITADIETKVDDLTKQNANLD